MSYVYVGTKRGERGVVWDDQCSVIGRVRQHARIAAGTNGQRGRFYTANAWTFSGYSGVSLGTRHPTRASAVRAIRMFWEWYRSAGYGVAYAYSDASINLLVAEFKRLHPEVCAR